MTRSRPSVRGPQATARQVEREARRRLRDLQRQVRETAKLSALAAARLEVEEYESRLDVILSVHKECSDRWDWMAIATSLPPPCPRRQNLNATKAQLQDDSEAHARAVFMDKSAYERELKSHAEQLAEWREMQAIARSILAGDTTAYHEALERWGALDELAEFGATARVTIHNARVVECHVTVDAQQAIPVEVKSLTSSGKVSVKPMPKSRRHELYQDYVCSCVLRVAREACALLPVDTVIATATTEVRDPSTGRPLARPVLSAAIERVALDQLDFEHIDPSEAMAQVPHRGSALASRESGEFEVVTPITSSDVAPDLAYIGGLEALVAAVRAVREHVREELSVLMSRHSGRVSPRTLRA